MSKHSISKVFSFSIIFVTLLSFFNCDFFYRERYNQLKNKIEKLQKIIIESQAVVANIDKLEKEINVLKDTCKKNNIDPNQLLSKFEKPKKSTFKPKLPPGYEDIPSFFRRKPLEKQYLHLVSKIEEYKPFIRKLALYRTLNTKCKKGIKTSK